MVNPVVMGSLRYNKLQVASNATGVSLFVAAFLMLDGLTRNVYLSDKAQRIGGVTVDLMLWFVLLVAMLLVVISRFFQILERTRELAMLKVLGASSDYIFNLLGQESLIICGIGTTVGIALGYFGDVMVGVIFHDVFLIRVPFDWWSIALLVSVTGFQISSFAASWIGTNGDGLMKAVTSDE